MKTTTFTCDRCGRSETVSTRKTTFDRGYSAHPPSPEGWTEPALRLNGTHTATLQLCEDCTTTAATVVAAAAAPMTPNNNLEEALREMVLSILEDEGGS